MMDTDPPPARRRYPAPVPGTAPSTPSISPDSDRLDQALARVAAAARVGRALTIRECEYGYVFTAHPDLAELDVYIAWWYPEERP